MQATTPNIDPPRLPKLSSTTEITHVLVHQIVLTMTKWLRSFHSSRGGGANGHVVIMTGTNAAWYNSLTNNAPAFNVPVHPGPPAVPAAATQHQILEYNRQYAHITGECNLIAALERAAMTCITDNWDESHYFELSDPTLATPM